MRKKKKKKKKKILKLILHIHLFDYLKENFITNYNYFVKAIIL